MLHKKSIYKKVDVSALGVPYSGVVTPIDRGDGDGIVVSQPNWRIRTHSVETSYCLQVRLLYAVQCSRVSVRTMSHWWRVLYVLVVIGSLGKAIVGAKAGMGTWCTMMPFPPFLMFG